MAIKSFNVSPEVYEKYSSFCKAHGISMSKQVEMFMESQLASTEVKKEYLERLERVRKGKFTRVDSFSKRYGLDE